MILPQGFVERMRAQLGSEAEAFFHSMETAPPISIRLNHFKGTSSFLLSERVKWCDQGYYLDERPHFHLDPHWHGGAYYVQEASSMILDELLRQLKFEAHGKIWLDLCAAPGGKTGILAKHLGQQDVLIANEFVSQRRSVLYENLVKGGFLNTFISGERSESIPSSFADVILIDAPCAGEGMMRKDPEAINQWSERLVQTCALLQREIVSEAIRSLKSGGYLIYSTCSYSPDENMHNADSFSDQLENVSIAFPDDWQIPELTKNATRGYQLFPHRVKGEGLFISVFRQKEASDPDDFRKKRPFRLFQPADSYWADKLSDRDRYLVSVQNEVTNIITKEAEDKVNEVRMKLPNAQLIGQIGERKGKDFIPDHFLAMNQKVKTNYPVFDLTLTQALDFLERKDPGLNLLPPDWYMVRYQGTGLGWMKSTGNGWKNHYPMNWRLRKRQL